jgi:hypothetical protein
VSNKAEGQEARAEEARRVRTKRDGMWRRFKQARLRSAPIWLVALSWTVYLAWAEAQGDRGPFAVVVQIMGSVGILYALFLVTRPGIKGRTGFWRFALDEGNGIRGKDERSESSSAARWTIISITIALAIGGVIYRAVQDSPLHQSAAFFIGVPTVLAITLALTPKARSATGMILKGTTLALLLSGIVFVEGFVCILMAAPLFYLVGILVGVPIDRARRRKQSEGRVYSIVGAVLLLASVEGVFPATSFSQREVVKASMVIDASVAEIEQKLASSPEFDDPLPFYLKLGFPRPVSGSGSGLAVGDKRSIFFGTESPMEPIGRSHEHHAPEPVEGGGLLELKIVRSDKGLVVFKPVQDSTAFTHWIKWGRSVVRWTPVDAHTTKVTWTLHFKRKLSPSWYFGPWQRYAGEKAAHYLIESVVAP